VCVRRDAAGRILAPQRRDELREGVEANLRSLRVERLDLVNLRLVDARQDGAIPLEEQLLALDDMREKCTPDLLGLSNVDLVKVQRALEVLDIAEIQNGYNIGDRHDEAKVDFACEREIAYVPFGPLGSDFRGRPARQAAAPAVARVADKHWATATQIALAWLLARYDRMLLIPGTSSVAHLDENMAAVELKLDVADLDALDRVGLDDES
jgi:pyridoxine 4-dehydrogenase